MVETKFPTDYILIKPYHHFGAVELLPSQIAGSRAVRSSCFKYYSERVSGVSYIFWLLKLRSINRELKQQRRRRLQKRHLKSEFAPLQTLSHLFHLVYFVKCWQMFLELNSKGLYQSSGKEKKVVVLC